MAPPLGRFGGAACLIAINLLLGTLSVWLVFHPIAFEHPVQGPDYSWLAATVYSAINLLAVSVALKSRQHWFAIVVYSLNMALVVLPALAGLAACIGLLFERGQIPGDFGLFAALFYGALLTPPLLTVVGLRAIRVSPLR